MSIFGRAGTRLASLGLAGVLVFLAVFAIASARVTNRSAHRVERSSVLGEAYAQAEKAVVSQGYWVTEYMLKLGPGARYLDAPAFRAHHRQAAEALSGALEVVRRDGGAADRAFATRLLALHRVYMHSARTLFAAVDAGDGKAAVGVQIRRVDPDFLRIKRLAQGASSTRRRQAFRDVLSLSHAHELIFAGTLLFFTFGLVLVGVFAWLLRTYRRRVEEATRAELAHFEHAALTDHLTGLGNHRAFHESLERELQRRARSGSPLSLIMLDLDGLKKANDSLGHQAGDELIQALAGCLSSSVRGGDSLYRIGGDEFAVILAGEGVEGAEEVLRRLEADFAAGSTDSPRSVTGGVAEAKNWLDRDSLVRSADLALVRAKRARPGDGREAAPRPPLRALEAGSARG